MDEHLGNIDLYRADFVTGPAEARSIWQALRMMHLHQLRREDRANRPCIHASIGVSAGLLIHRAGVLAGSATDAVQGLPRLGIRQYFGPRIVHEHDMKRTRPIAASRRLVDSRPDGVVRIHSFARGAARQQLKHYFEVLESWDDLVDSGDGNQRVGKGQAHPAITLALYNADSTRSEERRVGKECRSRWSPYH